MPNRLALEKSPYLLQHANNPVDWYPWGEEAFEKARREQKPIFLSIGYSTCHWCHVMERESFESEAVAEVMNRNFVSIKVDREERPDIDRIYMLFVQATTGSGGWPMSDLRPFFGGTYFPPDNRYGRPGFVAILEHIAKVWRDDRSKVEESGVQVVEQLKQQSEAASREGMLDEKMLESAFMGFRRMFDTRLGGFGAAPKFPRPVVHNFLLRYYDRTGNEEARDMVLATLRAMAKGGMNDQLGGGFHRYSVDARWFVPHFEKMLYDQAQLAISYLEAFQVSGEESFAQSARDIFEYVLRDMTSPEGGFYSAEDADSVIDPAHPHDKGEGAFYVWTEKEIEEALGQPYAAHFSYRYGVEDNGNVREDPHQEFGGKNILYQDYPVAQTAVFFDTTEEAVTESLEASRRKLLALRAGRVRPHLDDKILTAWNGLMISAFAKAGQVLNESRYASAARAAADFIAGRMWDPASGVLLRRYREGDGAIAGFSDDYAFFAQALIDLYETGFELRHLDLAAAVTERMIERFEDKENGAFFSTSGGDPDLVLRLKDDYDGAEPSANAAAVLNLLRLDQMLTRPDFATQAHRALEAFAFRMANGGVSVPQMLVAYLFSEGKPRQVVLAGERGSPDLEALLQVVRGRFSPHQVVMLNRPDMNAVDGKATAYVCENFTCLQPATSPEQLAGMLNSVA
jgi:uncharacterized protein YyaL (SSP411 family)